MVQHRDPLVEGLLRLGKATDFRQPAEGGAATTRAQIIRHLRPQNRDAVSAITSAFQGAEDARRLRGLASRAREAGARTPSDVVVYHKCQGALRILEARKARVREQDQAQDQLEAEVRSQLAVALEDQARLTRLQQEQQQQRDRASFLAQIVNRSKRLRPLLEDFTQRQRQQIQGVRARMLGEADCGSDAALQDRVSQLCMLVQQEVWTQLNNASKDAAASAAGMSGALMLTNGDQSMGHDVLSGALAAPLSGSSALPALEHNLHLWHGSPLRRQLTSLLNVPPQKLVQAICYLSRSCRNNLSVQVGGWDLLADARRRCQALGAAVDPLYDVRKMQQAQVDSCLELQRLDSQLLATKTRLLDLARMTGVGQALARAQVAARIKNDGLRAAITAARATLEGLVRDAEAQGQLVEEVGRLEAAAFELEREEQRLDGLVNLLGGSLHNVLVEWQQQHQANHEFLQRMLPKAYGDLADRAARNVDSLSRGVAELMRVPPELLPVLAEQRRMQRQQGQQTDLGRSSGASMGLPSPSSLSLVERMRLTWPFVGPSRTASLLRAAAASGCSAYAGMASTHGSLLIRSSVASTASSQGAQSTTSDAVLLGGCSVSGSVNASLNGGGGSGCWASGAGTNTAGGGALNTMGSWPGPGGSRASGAAENLHGSGFGPGPGGGGGLGGSGSWLLGPGGGGGGGSSSAPAIPWGPGPAALGLPTLCYWLATATALDPLAPFRCPAALLRDLHERFQAHDQMAKWLASADAQLQPRYRELSGLGAAVAALRETLEAKRQHDITDKLNRLVRSRRDLMEAMEVDVPKVRRAMREMEEQGAVKLVPWRRVNGLTALEMLNEIRSIFARINQLQQQQPLQPHERPYSALMPPPARPGF